MGKFCACMHMFCIYSQNVCVCVCEGVRFVCMFVCIVAKPQSKHEFTWILLILLTLLNFSKKGREKIKRRCLELVRF